MPSSNSAHRQKFVGCKTTTVPLGYIGETKKNLREGYGVYTYTNSFFRYEGEWQKGVKQGYGRLKMRDGSYYEGLFKNGEITGRGVRYWSSSKNLYEGDFLDGEMDGKGIMKYGDGGVYEGYWIENKRQGEGVLKTDDGEYNGNFYYNKYHGEGKMAYSDGGKYLGGWINGMRHGHGVMTFGDGSTYEGQWRSDKMNGEGSLHHSSDICYDGMWSNGRPLMEPYALTFGNDDEILELDQNEVVFDVNINCVTSDGDVTIENGRLLKLTAGIRLPEKIKQTSSKASSIGTQPSNITIQTSQPNAEPQDIVERLETPFGYDVEVYPLSFLINIEANKTDEQTLDDETNAATPTIDITEKSETVINDGDFERQNVESLTTDMAALNSSTSIVEPRKTLSGKVAFLRLTLSSVQNASPTQSSMSVAMRDIESGPKSRNKGRRTTDIDKDIRENSGRRKKNAKQEEKVKEVYNENFCKPGDYVLIVEDITENPFLGIKLEPCYLQIKIITKSKH